jgi:mercuric reductase
MSSGYDLVILGSGTTAIAGALRAARRDARVLMVEQSQVGGTCVNWGCIPSKTLIAKGIIQHWAGRGAEFGLNLEAAFPDCAGLMACKRRAVETVRRERYQKALDETPGIEVRRGHGQFISPRELRVGADILTCERFLIATGGVPKVLRIPGLSEVPYLTSYSALHLSCFPASLIIIGGGVIALEMGQMFARFGTRVTIVERSERMLREFDPRLTTIFQGLLADEGVELVLGAETREVRREGEDVVLEVEVGGAPRALRGERLMLAVGTAPASVGIGLEEAGVATGAGDFIRTDEEMRTTAAGIWAAGDVTGPPLIAPAGAREAEVAVANMFDPDAHQRIDHRHTPMAVFVDPEFASVGLSAEPARAEGKEVVETWLDLEQVAKSHVLGQTRGGFLLTAERGSGRVLGVQLLAPRAADIIHEATLAVRFGLSVYDLAETVHAYPTISDGLRLAALENVQEQGR